MIDNKWYAVRLKWDGTIIPNREPAADYWQRQVVDGNGDLICNCDTAEIAKEIAIAHNTTPDLLTACEKVPRLLKEIRGFASDVFGGESSLTDCIDLVLTETEAAIAKAKGNE